MVVAKPSYSPSQREGTGIRGLNNLSPFHGQVSGARLLHNPRYFPATLRLSGDCTLVLASWRSCHGVDVDFIHEAPGKVSVNCFQKSSRLIPEFLAHRSKAAK